MEQTVAQPAQDDHSVRSRDDSLDTRHARSDLPEIDAKKFADGVHAAMGITEEYDLQLYTRRLIEWRTDYGSAGYWNRRVGDAVLSSEAPSTLEFMLPVFFADTAPR